MGNTSLQQLRMLFSQGDTEDALEKLAVWMRENLPEQQNEVILLQGSLKTDSKEFFNGTITGEEYRTRRNRINQAALGLISTAEQTTQADSYMPESDKLHEYHCYTCDRVTQKDTFDQLVKAGQPGDPQFYFIYGAEMHAHEGFFKRLSYELEGRLLDYIDGDPEGSCQVVSEELTFDFSQQYENYLQNILKSFFAALNVPANEHEPILQKDLRFVFEHSPKLQGLANQDYVCVFLYINYLDWDSEITPKATRWFIKEFCKSGLPPDAPQLLFFLGIEYEEDDQTLRQEILEVVQKSDVVDALPELNFVEKRDLQRWFNKYRKIEPSTAARKKLLETTFGQTNQHYMEEVQISLRRLIKEYNKGKLS